MFFSFVDLSLEITKANNGQNGRMNQRPCSEIDRIMLHLKRGWGFGIRHGENEWYGQFHYYNESQDYYNFGGAIYTRCVIDQPCAERGTMKGGDVLVVGAGVGDVAAPAQAAAVVENV